MSGYDPFTGVFELIAARVHRWLRRDTAYVGGNTSMERAANLLAQEGLKVQKVRTDRILILHPLQFDSTDDPLNRT